MPDRVTPAQRRALEAIRDDFGRCGLGDGGWIAAAYGSSTPRQDVVDRVITAGLAERGGRMFNRSYVHKLVLTPAGEEVLADA